MKRLRTEATEVAHRVGDGDILGFSSGSVYAFDGVFLRALQQIREQADAFSDIDWLVQVGSAIVQSPTSTPPPAEEGAHRREEPDDHALGRSRGGLTTKVHLACDGRGRPLARPRRRPHYVIADKAYSFRGFRGYLRRRGIAHTISEKTDQRRHRHHRGRIGGRPPGFNREVYRSRDPVERCFNQLKSFRAIATRYEKTATSYEAAAALASLLLWPRSVGRRTLVGRCELVRSLGAGRGQGTEDGATVGWQRVGEEWVVKAAEVGGAARAQTPFDVSERRAWAGSAAAYEAGFGRLCAYPVPALLEAAGVGQGMRVLDVGTGPGVVAAAAGARGAQVVALDSEPGMAQRAAQGVPDASVCIAALPQLPFMRDQFDAVVGNFVLNHVGRPRVALAELRRVTRPGGRIALTIWAVPAASGQALLGRAAAAAGVPRPADVPALAPEDDFPRTEEGLRALLSEAGLTEAGCRSLAWDHRTTAEEWWQGPAAGVATIGRVVTSQGVEGVERVRRHFALLAEEFMDGEGGLVLPHRALLAYGRVRQAV